MIGRAWRGYAAITEGDAYPKHLLQSVRPKLEQLPGFQGLVPAPAPGDGRDRVSRAYAVGVDGRDPRFAGDQPERAVVEPEARAALVRFESMVAHYEVLVAPDRER